MYVFFLMLAELVTCYFIHAGVLVHLFILGALLVHSVFLDDKPVSDLLTALAIAPLIRILGLSTPLMHFSQITWFAIVSVPMFITGITIARLQGLSAKQLYLTAPKKRYFPLEALVIAICFPVGLLEYYLLKPSPLADFSLQAILAPSLIFLINTGFLEEFIFRGLLQHHAERLAGFRGIVLISALFGILHITNLVFWDAVLAGGVGLMFALVVRKTGSLWGVSMAHGVVNITLFLIAPHLFSW